MIVVFFFFKQKTAYEMRISDWSSDVCSSDLENGNPDLGLAAAGRAALAQDASTVVGNPAGMTRLDRSQLTGSVYTIIPSMQFDRGSGTTTSGGNGFNEIGRASCRDRVCRYV